MKSSFATLRTTIEMIVWHVNSSIFKANEEIQYFTKFHRSLMRPSRALVFHVNSTTFSMCQYEFNSLH